MIFRYLFYMLMNIFLTITAILLRKCIIIIFTLFKFPNGRRQMHFSNNLSNCAPASLILKNVKSTFARVEKGQFRRNITEVPAVVRAMKSRSLRGVERY